MARLRRVFIDTSELFPFSIMDLLLSLSEDFLFTWVWTDELLAEWQEVIVRAGRRTPESAASVAAAVHTYFGRSRLDPILYRGNITEDLSPDPDDRVHAAAAIHGNVDVLLTRNIKHLRTRPVLAAGVEVMTADEFLCGLLAGHPRAVMSSFLRTADGKANPPMTPVDLASRLTGAGAPLFAQLVQTRLGV